MPSAEIDSRDGTHSAENHTLYVMDRDMHIKKSDPQIKGSDLHIKEKSVERAIDDASRGSFPASDPPAYSGATATPTGEDDENVTDPPTVAEFDVVDLAHGGSFPASDPPGSSGSTATRSGRE